MSTGEAPNGATNPVDATAPSNPGGDLAAEIARLANDLFARVPGLTSPASQTFVPAAQTGNAPVVRGPSHPGPYAFAPGGAGASPSLNAPPLPGAAYTPPLAAAPLPKETDLRTLPATFSAMFVDVTPLSLPLGLVSGGDFEAAAPYFVALAGYPSPPLGEAATPPTDVPATPRPSAAVPTTLDGPTPEVNPPAGLFDPNSVKRDFPILRERVHGRRLVWLDNAATTQKPQSVIDRISSFYEHENSNVHRAAHTLAARATDAYESARNTVRRFLNAPSSKDVIFVRGTTEAINLVAQSWGRRNVGPGDEIVITWLEHHANIIPWQQLASERGARLRVAPVDDRGQVMLDELERLLGPRTRIISVSQVSNALGTIVPVRQIVEMGHRYGARVLIDGAQAVSHLPVDVQALDCDFYCFSGHKIFGPTGIGALYGKAEVLDAMPPWQGGGNMIDEVTFERTTYQRPPARFEAGTGNIADAVGLGAALDYVSALGLENISRYEHELLVYATQELVRVPGLRLIGTAPEKAGVLSFILDGVRTEDVGGILDQEGIAVRSGHHCAQPILRRFGLESTVRASLAPYNTREDIDALVAALLRLQAGRPAKGL